MGTAVRTAGQLQPLHFFIGHVTGPPVLPLGGPAVLPPRGPVIPNLPAHVLGNLPRMPMPEANSGVLGTGPGVPGPGIKFMGGSGGTQTKQKQFQRSVASIVSTVVDETQAK